MRGIRSLSVVAAFLAASGALAQGVPIKSGASGDLWTVNGQKAGLIVTGNSSRPTYRATVSGQATTAAVVLSIESSAGTGFRLTEVCVSSSPATAGAAVTVTIQRRTTASSGGTALTAEGTGTTAISKMDPADGNYPGIARLGGTPGTAGAVLDQWSFTVPEVGTVDSPLPSMPCRRYGENGGKSPVVPAGVTSGLSITVSAAGAGGLAAGSITAEIIVE